MAQSQNTTAPSTTDSTPSSKKPHYSVALIDNSKDVEKGEFWDFVGVAYQNKDSVKVILNKDVPKGSQLMLRRRK